MLAWTHRNLSAFRVHDSGSVDPRPGGRIPIVQGGATDSPCVPTESTWTGLGMESNALHSFLGLPRGPHKKPQHRGRIRPGAAGCYDSESLERGQRHVIDVEVPGVCTHEKL